jgi:hypothetical protein
MTPTQAKEELYNQVYNRMAYNPDRDIMERATQKTSLYIVSLLIAERKVLTEVLELKEDIFWKETEQEILNDIQAWKS